MYLCHPPVKHLTQNFGFLVDVIFSKRSRFWLINYISDRLDNAYLTYAMFRNPLLPSQG